MGDFAFVCLAMLRELAQHVLCNQVVCHAVTPETVPDSWHINSRHHFCLHLLAWLSCLPLRAHNTRTKHPKG